MHIRLHHQAGVERRRSNRIENYARCDRTLASSRAMGM